ncbi:protein of unknown function DUF4704 [Trinorchestia longiramus]|nr:protein of unknown function DUF4704 [Trinorchestia longiramus]
MNIMRKWWGTGGRLEGEEGYDGAHQGGGVEQQGHLALGLMHLKKLFSEILHPAHPLSEDEREDKLYNMLPLFCKVFSSSSPTDLMEKFEDVLLFTQHVSRLMVTEIRRRASNQSTAAASCAIVRFLEMEGEEGVDGGPNSPGWLLLNALNLLADGPPQIIEVMTATSLPSTLVKCLYLFFDLPDPEPADTDNANSQAPVQTYSNNVTASTRPVSDSNQDSPQHHGTQGSAPAAPDHLNPAAGLQATQRPPKTASGDPDVSSSDRRVLLQKVFVQVMLRLCSHSGPAEELARKDDLSLVFSASTSWCSPHNVVWRKSAAEVLMSLSRHGLSQPVIAYIHSKGCIALCVENMERTQDLSPLEIVEMLVAIFCFLKDSADVSQILLDDFKAAQGYAFLVDFMLRLEHESLASNSGICSPAGDSSSSSSSGGSNSNSPASAAPASLSEGLEALRNLVLLVVSLSYCGHSQPRPSLHPSTSLYTIPGFTLPAPASRGCSVRNVSAFGVLQLVFCRATSATLCNIVLDAIASVYHSDSANYFILESQATLSTFAEKMHTRTHQVQAKYFELIELVVFELNHVPCKELISLSLLLKAHHAHRPRCVILCLNTLLKVLRHHTLFKDVYREVGLLEVLVTCVERYPVLLSQMTPDKTRLPLSRSRTEDDEGEAGNLSPAEQVCVLALDVLHLLLASSAGNACVFREAGGVQLMMGLLHYPRCRTSVLGVFQQLIVAGGNDEDMMALLDVLNAGVQLPGAPAAASDTTVATDEAKEKSSTSVTVTNEQLQLKVDVLKTLVTCLKDSHRSRAVFRKVGGFVRVLSVVVGMRDAFHDCPPPPYDATPPQLLLSLIGSVFSCLTTAMRYEPANAKFFHAEICNGSLCETLRQLGCFSSSCVRLQSSDASHWTTLLIKSSSGTSSPSRTPAPSAATPSSPLKTSAHSQSLLSNLTASLKAASLSSSVGSVLSGAPSASPAAGNTPPVKTAPDSPKHQDTSDVQSAPASVDDHVIVNAFHVAFTTPLLEYTAPPWLPVSMVRCVQLLQLLYHMALDSHDKTAAAVATAPVTALVPPLPHQESERSSSPNSIPSSKSSKRPGVGGLNLGGVVNNEVVIVHSGVVITLLYLLPSLLNPKHLRLSALLQLYTAHLIKSLVRSERRLTFTVMFFLLQSLVRSERNQQVMCVGGLCRVLGEWGAVVLLEEHHPLHPLLHYIYERLAAHCITPPELRSFLRLGDPLNCRSVESFNCNDEATHRGPVPLSRIKTIVSMTTPRHTNRGPSSSAITPMQQVAPFVEFDMSAEGFGCLFLPSLAPHSVTSSAGGVGSVSTAAAAAVGSALGGPSSDQAVTGGIGSGDRPFPPQSGLSYSTWFTVERYSDPRSDPHCVRLLTVVRTVPGPGAQLLCLLVCLSARDKALIVSTQETPLPPHGQMVQELEPPITSDSGCRVWCPDLLTEGHWHHLVITINSRAVLKTSTLTVYVDGKTVHTQRDTKEQLKVKSWPSIVLQLQYISQTPGGLTANLNVSSSVYGYIGSAPCYRRLSRLVWRQGVCHLLEDVLSQTSVGLLHQLGPNYTGSLQAPQLPGCEAGPPIVLEEKVMFGLNAAALSHFTLSKIRKFYSKVDSKAIAKQLGMSSHENATPIRVVHNSAGHLTGPARTMGGVVIGYLGVRVFCPRPVASVIQTLGGTSVMLGLVAMASDVETLYAAVKALSCVVRSNKSAQVNMSRSSGYQILGQLLHRKLHLLNSHILHLCLGLVTAGESYSTHKLVPSSPAIPNVHAFTDIVLDLELWCRAPGDLWKSLLEYLLELAKESPDRYSNLKIMRSVGLVPRFLLLFYDYLSSRDCPLPAPPSPALPLNSSPSGGMYSHGPVSSPLLYSLMTVLLAVNPRQEDLLSYGQFIVATLPPATSSEKDIEVDTASLIASASSRPAAPPQDMEGEEQGRATVPKLGPASSSGTPAPSISMSSNGSCSPVSGSPRAIALRNKCLEILHTLLYNSNKNTIHLGFCEELVRVLGLDWVVVLTGPNLHPSTVLFALRMLVALLSNASVLQRFREASSNGGWLASVQQVISNRQGLVLGYSVGGRGGGGAFGEVREEVCCVAGFQTLTSNMTNHVKVAPAYYLLVALMLGQPVKTAPTAAKLELSSIWTYVFGSAVTGGSGNISGRACLCPEALITVLTMIRTVISPGFCPPAWLHAYPQTLLEFVQFLHLHNEEFLPVLLSCDVVTALALTLFPASEGDLITTPHSDKKGNLLSDMEVVCATNSTKSLSQHPAKEEVVALLERLVLDSLLMPPPSKPPHTVDYILDAPPEESGFVQMSEFQTLVLGALMARVQQAVAGPSDVLEGTWIRQGGYIPAGGSSSNLPPNLFYLIARMVDKLWAGLFDQDPHPLLDLIVSLIGCAKRSVSTVHCLDLIYSCLNRTVLFLLSRPCSDTTLQRAILQGLHKLTTHRVIVFGAGNHDLEFVACLTHCLLQLTAQLQISTDSTSRTVWHVNSSSASSPQGSPTSSAAETAVQVREAVKQRDEAVARATQSHHLMVTAATRVWEELYITKKPAIEEVFKVSLTVSNSSSRAPDLETVRVQITETALKLWVIFLENEKKQNYTSRMMPWEMPTHFQTVTNVSKKLQKVTGGLSRLASRTKSRREDSVVTRKTPVNLSPVEVQRQTAVHTALVKELVAVQHCQQIQKQEDLSRYWWGVWEKEERELTRERGLWGPLSPSHLDKWMLDVTEGPCRMRKKMVANPLFYLHYPPHKALSELEQGRQSKYKMACSFHSEEYQRKRRPLGLASRDQQNGLQPTAASKPAPQPDTHIESFVGKDVTEMDVSGLKGRTSNPAADTSDAGGASLINEDDGDPSELLDSGIGLSEQSSLQQPEDVHTPDNQSLLRLLEHDDKVSHMFRCARIQGLDTTESLLLFGREHFYIVDGFTLLKSREIRDIESLPPGSHEPVIPSATSGGWTPAAGLSDPHACYKLHYDEIREALQRRYLLQPIAIEIFSSDGRNYLLAFPKAKERNKVYQRLLVVCTGLADSAHQSVEGQRRSASVEQTGGLFSSLIGETSVTHRWVRGEISNFQYLMHLNTLAGRSYNDLMQYPIFPWVLADYESSSLDFSSPLTFRDLTKPMGAQTPDRLEQFRKRYREWDDPSGETPPYHYGTHYSSAMIVSSYLVRMEPFTQHFLRLQGGHFDLADRMFHSLKEAWLSASRNNMADIKELIPEFFYLPEFMQNSNQFDLGIKQSGVQLDDVILPPWAKGDPREFIRLHRAALECDYVSAHLHHWIDLIFGCKQQGQQAVEAVNVFHHLFYEGNVDIYSIDDPLKQKATIGFINNFGQIPKQLFRRAHPCKKLGGQRSSIMEASPLTQAPAVTPRDKVFYKNFELLRSAMQPIKEVKGVVGQIISLDKGVLAVEQNKVLIPASYQRYLAWGFADYSLRVGQYESEKALLVYEGDCGHTGEVLAAVCPNSRTVITASTDTVVRVYEIYRRQLSPKCCLYGHSDAVTCVATSAAFGVLVSGSRDKTAIIWDLARLGFVRQLTGHHAPLAACAISDSTGDIGTCGGTWLHVWSINGVPIASVNTALGARSALQQVLCLTFTTSYEWDQDNLILTGSSDGVIRMWGLEYVQTAVEEDSDNSSSDGSSSNKAKSGAVPREDSSTRSSFDHSPDHSPAALGSRRSSRKADQERRASQQLREEGQFSGSYFHKSLSVSSLSDEDDSYAEDILDGDPAPVGDTKTVETGGSKAMASEASNSASATKKSSSTAPESTTTAAGQTNTGLAGDHSTAARVEENLISVAGAAVSETGSLTTEKSNEKSTPVDVEREAADEESSSMLGTAAQATTKRLSPSGERIVTLHRQEALASTSSQPSFDTSGSVDTPVSTSPKVLHAPPVCRTVSAVDQRPDALVHPSALHKRLQSSKSETCLSDTAAGLNLSSAAGDAFEVISEAEVREARSHDALASPAGKSEVLMPGMRWVCQLVFRRQLTAHTAYDRSDNVEPASVTAITVAKDHRSVLVGDARGRVFSWSVVEGNARSAVAPLRAAAVRTPIGRTMSGSSSNLSSSTDHWVSDDLCHSCSACHLKFSVYERKHHCRNCGFVYCSKCSRFESEIFRLKIFKPVRVCQKCYVTLKGDKFVAP